jgi:hypothetical protein
VDYDPFARVKTNTQHAVRISTEQEGVAEQELLPSATSILPSPVTPGAGGKKGFGPPLLPAHRAMGARELIDSLDIDGLAAELAGEEED